ncbi:MAG: hypothetical protein FJ026_11010 [Chloroflexi bacterium]|nr:hypothetical protein [Chloroflexota bacterium]
MRTKIVLVSVLAALLLTSSALALSAAYRLDWLVPLTGGGGGPASSTNYKVNLTVGQTAIGASSSTNYKASLGYWYGIPAYNFYLPLVLKNFPNW